MPMSGASLSTKVQNNMVSNPPSDPATAHVKAWDNVGKAVVSEMLAATLTANITCNAGGGVFVPVDPATIDSTAFKNAIKGAIAGVTGVTPANAHQKYWDAISTSGVVGYVTANLKLVKSVGTSSPVGHTYTPSFGAKTGADLGADIRTKIAGVGGVTPANSHDLYWAAASDAITKFIKDNYGGVPSPGVGGSGTTLTVSVS